MNKRPEIPRWKYWLSYLTEVHIESAPSEINPHLYVSLLKGKIQLCSENAVYSYEDRYDNFRLLFDEIELGSKSFKRALVLGLGLGSVPILLEQSGLQLDNMVFVELDEQVIYLAEKYALKILKTPHTTVCGDASVFVNTYQEKFDLILSDIFLDDVIPDYFLSIDYLQQLNRLLDPEGLLIINTLASTKEDKILSQAYFESIFKEAFPSGELRHVWENYMLLNRKEGTS